MNRALWYYLLLLMPDLIPSAIWVLGLVPEPGTEYESTSTLSGILYNAISYWLNFVSLPYMAFAGAALFRCWNKTADEIQAASWRLPLFFAPAFLPVFYLANRRPGLAYMQAPLFCFFIMLCVILLGYFYVLLAHVLTWVLQKMRLVSD